MSEGAADESKEAEPLDASAVPEYLKLTHELVDSLNQGANPVEAVVTAFANLEKFVRTKPDDQVLLTIDEGPLDQLPITKRAVGRIEDFAYKTNGNVPYGLAALQRLGVLLDAVRALELKIRGV